MTVADEKSDVDVFIERWRNSTGAERANFQPFAVERCKLIGIAPPEPSDGSAASLNAYAFERSIDFKAPDATITKGRVEGYFAE